MKLSARQLLLLCGVLIATLILLTLAIAPTKDQQSRGSTYGRSPQQYGAWYSYMEAQGVTIERWEQPFEDLSNPDLAETPITFIRILPLQRFRLSSQEKKWVEQGNTLVLLGIRQPVTEANFTTTLQDSTVGAVEIATRRRKQKPKTVLLGDQFGAVVWEERFGKGKVILCTTPYLGSNAYQDIPGNYKFLSQLVQDNPSSQIKVDEYIQGYKDQETITEEIGDSIFSYLQKTPFFPAFIQIILLIVVASWAGNRRFGMPLSLSPPQVNNSKAYIQALAEVLQKAENRQFVMEILGKEEQLQLQKSLGLGTTPLDIQSLVDEWVQHTGRSPSELEQLLQESQQSRLSDLDLLGWLEKWDNIRTQL